jgi:hypothetical protein
MIAAVAIIVRVIALYNRNLLLTGFLLLLWFGVIAILAICFRTGGSESLYLILP